MAAGGHRGGVLNKTTKGKKVGKPWRQVMGSDQAIASSKFVANKTRGRSQV